VTTLDAARHLSILFGEDVTEADVLQLALDGYLALSVRFVNKAPARYGKSSVFVHRTEMEISNPEANKVIEPGIGGLSPPSGVVSWEKEIEFIDGIWDLLMVGSGRTSVEQRYQFLTDGRAVETLHWGGLLVNRPDGTWCGILEYRSELEHLDKIHVDASYDHSDHYYPADALPSDAALVVRTSALQDLEARLSKPEPNVERPVGQRERTTLLVIIAALAELNGIDVKKPSKAALEIESATIRMGARVAARTIEEHLRHIREAMEKKGAEE